MLYKDVLMLTLHPCLDVHQGWQIQVSQETEGFYFDCYPPNRAYACNDGCIYEDLDSAHAAARIFIDQEIAVQALIASANDWLRQGLICEEEYWNLTDFD